MIKFKDYLEEMPFVSAAITKITPHKVPKESKKVGSLGNYHIMEHPKKEDGFGGYSFVHKKTGKQHFQIRGWHVTDHIFGVTKAVKHKDFEHNGHAAYKEMTKHKALVSDEVLSPGAGKLYKSLAGDKDLHVRTFNKQKKTITPDNIHKHLNDMHQFIVTRKT